MSIALLRSLVRPRGSNRVLLCGSSRRGSQRQTPRPLRVEGGLVERPCCWRSPAGVTATGSGTGQWPPPGPRGGAEGQSRVSGAPELRRDDRASDLAPPQQSSRRGSGRDSW